MRLPEIFKSPGLQHDPDKVLAYHEVAHSLLAVSHGLLPIWTSLVLDNGFAFTSGQNELGLDYGEDWKRSGCIFDIKQSYAGLVGGSYYSGIYDYAMAKIDLDNVAKMVSLYPKINFRIQILAWFQVHEFIENNADLLQEAAEKLYIDRVLGWEYWEHVLFTI